MWGWRRMVWEVVNKGLQSAKQLLLIYKGGQVS